MPDAYTQIPRSQNSEGRLMAGVASAAVVSGELIIGLDDGRIIRAGYVQGPTGKTGPEGAIGATGQRGMDGNTILSGAEKPKPDAGKEGDFWINTRDWYIYGPKTSGQWGTGTYMLGPKHYLKNSRSNQGGGGTAPSSEGGGGTGTVFSNNVFLSGTGRAISAPGGNIIPEGLNLSVQSNLNKWIENSLRALDTKLPVAVVDSLPGTGQYDGDLVLFEGALYVWVGSEWIKVSADGGAHIGVMPPMPAEEGQLWFNNNENELTLYIYDGWVPAAPPVSLDGINTTITGIEGDLIELHNNVRQVKGDIVLTNQDLQLVAQGQQDLVEDQTRQDEKIAELEAEVDDLRPTIERGEWLYNSEPESESNPKAGEYHAYVIVSDDYCKQQLGECLLNAGGDTAAASQCNRENEDCLSKIGEADTDVTWHEVEWLSLAKADQEGRAHDFGDVVPGMYIEAVNLDGSGHGLYIIEGKSPSPTRCGFLVKPVHSTGHPNGKAVLKIFKMAEAANPEDYVRKSGDTMSGELIQSQPHQLSLSMLSTKTMSMLCSTA